MIWNYSYFFVKLILKILLFGKLKVILFMLVNRYLLIIHNQNFNFMDILVTCSYHLLLRIFLLMLVLWIIKRKCLLFLNVFLEICHMSFGVILQQKKSLLHCYIQIAYHHLKSLFKIKSAFFTVISKHNLPSTFHKNLYKKINFFHYPIITFFKSLSKHTHSCVLLLTRSDFLYLLR